MLEHLSWKSKRVSCLFDKEDMFGNKVMTMSGMGLFSHIRYVESHGCVYFSVKDIMEMFCVEDVYAIWEQMGMEVRDEFSSRLFVHSFKTDMEMEGITLDCFTMYFNDIIKLLSVLPLTFEERSKGIDAFIDYYQINFRLIKEYSLKPGRHCCLTDCCYNSLLFAALLMGFLLAFIVFWTCKLL